MGVQEDEQMLSDADGAIAEGTWPEPKGGGPPALAYHRRSYRIMRMEDGVRAGFRDTCGKALHVTCDYLLGYSESRTGLTGFFISDELEQDREMSISTIYRAASRLLEAVNLEWDTVLGDRMQWLFALSVYNGMVTSSQAGFLSKDAIHFDPQAAELLTSGMMEAIARSIINSGSEVAVAAHEDKLPQCMQTLILEAENYIRRNVDQYLSGGELR